MAKQRKSAKRKTYNQLFAALPQDQQEEHLSLLARWLAGVFRSRKPPKPPPLK